MSSANEYPAAARAAGEADAAPLKPNVSGAWGKTSIVALWVPVLVGAHLFAGFWLYQAWRLGAPAQKRRRSRHSGASGPRARLCRMLTPPAPVAAAWSSVAAPATQQLQRLRAKLGIAVGSPTAAKADILAVGKDKAAAAAAAGARASSATESSDDCAVDAEAAAAAEHAKVIRALEEAPPGSPLRPHHANGFGAAAAAGAGGVAGAAAPPPAASLEWRGVGCSYNLAGGVKEVLADVWGVAPSGEMQALLGPSGAGKSTLMDILAMRKSLGNLTGTLLVNGRRASRRFVRMTAYVPQEDNFVPTMTTDETLSFYADVRAKGGWAEMRGPRAALVARDGGLGRPPQPTTHPRTSTHTNPSPIPNKHTHAHNRSSCRASGRRRADASASPRCSPRSASRTRARRSSAARCRAAS